MKSDQLKLALVIIGAMRIMADFRKKAFAAHLLKGVLLQEDFSQRGSSVIEKQSKLLADRGDSPRPPLVEILLVMKSVKASVSALEAQCEASTDKSEKKHITSECNRVRALSRNLNLLIIDIFKELDVVLEKIVSPPKAQDGADTSQPKKITISEAAMNSLSQLLTLGEIDKKQL